MSTDLKIAQVLIPLPPSANNRLASIRTQTGARQVSTKELKAWKKRIPGILLEQRPPSFGSAPIVVVMDIHFPDSSRRRDIVNYEKAATDALDKYGVFDDDSQIIDYRVSLRGNVPGGVMMITITEASEVDVERSQRVVADRPREWGPA